MKKILSLILLLLFFSCTCEAKNFKQSVNSVINDSKISQNSISISVKDADTGAKVYSLNDKILFHPASVQKLLTIVPIVEILGNDYNFKTELYSRGNSAYVIKLGADPYLSTSDLKELVNRINQEQVKNIYIDDSIVEQKDWGEGWQWDDDLNTFMPRFNAYNLDGNIISITVMPTTEGRQATIINSSKYPLAFFNYVTTGNQTNIKISRNNIIAANAIKLEGTVNSPYQTSITNNNLKRYFEVKLTNALEDRNIYLKETYGTTTVKPSDKKIGKVFRPIKIAVDDILQNSNNMAIESIAKIAAGKYYKKQGTDTDAINLFNKFYEQYGLNKSRIKIVDASGVSKNNLTDADFITEYLVKNQSEKVMDSLAQPGVGTLTERMLPLKNNLKAKTGTLSDISSIAGYLTARNGNKYAFCIIINDPASSNTSKKNLENYILRELYMKL